MSASCSSSESSEIGNCSGFRTSRELLLLLGELFAQHSRTSPGRPLKRYLVEGIHHWERGEGLEVTTEMVPRKGLNGSGRIRELSAFTARPSTGEEGSGDYAYSLYGCEWQRKGQGIMRIHCTVMNGRGRINYAYSLYGYERKRKDQGIMRIHCTVMNERGRIRGLCVFTVQL